LAGSDASEFRFRLPGPKPITHFHRHRLRGVGELVRRLRVSFEFRNASWFTDDVYAILRRHGAALCLAERDEMATPEIRTAGFAYLRLRKSSHPPAVQMLCRPAV